MCKGSQKLMRNQEINWYHTCVFSSVKYSVCKICDNCIVINMYYAYYVHYEIYYIILWTMLQCIEWHSYLNDCVLILITFLLFIKHCIMTSLLPNTLIYCVYNHKVLSYFQYIKRLVQNTAYHNTSHEEAPGLHVYLLTHKLSTRHF